VVHELVLGRLEELQMPPKGPSCLDLTVQLPHLSFCFAERQDELSSNIQTGFESIGQYNIRLKDLAVTGRLQSDEEHAASREVSDRTSLHVSVGSLEAVILQEPSSDPFSFDGGTPALFLELNEVLVWFTSWNLVQAMVQLGNLSWSFDSKQIPFLVHSGEDLLHLVEEVGHSFEARLSDQFNSARQLIYNVALSGRNTDEYHDPAILTRPSYVLITSHDHVRTFDSWKILLRIRHIYKSLPKKSRSSIMQRRLADSEIDGTPDRERFIRIFKDWRGWELLNIDNSVVISVIFPPSGASSEPSRPISGRLRMQVLGLALVVDPGPSQSEFLLDDWRVQVDLNPLRGVYQEVTGKINCKDIKLRVAWSLLDFYRIAGELTLKGKNRRKRRSEFKVQNNKIEPSTPLGRVHIVAIAESGSMVLSSMNLKVLSISQNIKCSFLYDRLTGSDTSSLASALISAEVASSEISSQGKSLLLASAQDSVLCGSMEQQSDESSADVWK